MTKICTKVLYELHALQTGHKALRTSILNVQIAACVPKKTFARNSPSQLSGSEITNKCASNMKDSYGFARQIAGIMSRLVHWGKTSHLSVLVSKLRPDHSQEESASVHANSISRRSTTAPSYRRSRSSGLPVKQRCPHPLWLHSYLRMCICGSAHIEA